ncbi:MAG: DUF424 family protein [Candidatus Aenigmarchaeota archaeon]|nr:DUF424 family protein [Candidatus Aenigmarchaeota archaeon]
MKKFSYKLFKNGNNLLALADKDILGKTFKSKDLEIVISKDFYYEGFCDEKELAELLKKSTIVNAIGQKSVNFLIENDLADKKNVLRPCGIPHVQIITF